MILWWLVTAETAVTLADIACSITRSLPAVRTAAKLAMICLSGAGMAASAFIGDWYNFTWQVFIFLAWFLDDDDRRKIRRAARLAGAKTRALLDSVVEKMREAGKPRHLQPVPVPH